MYMKADSSKSNLQVANNTSAGCALDNSCWSGCELRLLEDRDGECSCSFCWESNEKVAYL